MPRNASSSPTFLNHVENQPRGVGLRNHSILSLSVAEILSCPDGFCYWAGSARHQRWIKSSQLADLIGVRSADAVNLWISNAGVKVSAHYDAYRNALSQLHGRKSVTLFPPRDAGKLQLFPSLDSRYRQARHMSPPWPEG